MTNCYVVSSGEGGCWLVDAGFEPGEMLDFVAEKKLQLRQVVLTHAHLDHIAGLSEVRDRYPQVPIVVHEAERAFLVEPALNLSIMLGEPVIAPQATGTLAHGQVLQLDDLSFEVRHTPGHSPGGICLYNAEHATAITGDTLFAGSVGRHDFPTADGWALMKSIREQLLTLPDETKVLPGHGPATTIGRERRSNPFLR
jgi:glyoxylase-like metal-dependent hydrolase (beta-lactamase superfamily II)